MEFNLVPKQKLKRHRYTNEDKLRMIDDFRTYGIAYAISTNGVDKSSIYKWVSKEEDIERSVPAHKRRKIDNLEAQQSLSRTQEDQLMSEVTRMRKLGIAISGLLVRLSSLKLAQDAGDSSFRASVGWLERFKRRHGLVFRSGTKRSYKKIPQAVIPTLKKWHLGLCQTIKNQKINWIVNIDETPVCYDLAFNKTLHKKGALEVLIDNVDSSKKRVTLILGIFISVDTNSFH